MNLFGPARETHVPILAPISRWAVVQTFPKIRARLRKKVKQVSEGKRNYLPAIAAVVGFSSMKVLRANVR